MTTFQKLTKKEKVEHIWEYYRYHILGGAFAIFIVSSLLIQVFGPQPPEPLASVVVMGVYAQDMDKVDQLKKEMESIIEGDGEFGPVELSMHQVDFNSNSPMDAAMNQKLMLMFQAKEIDVLIVEESKFDSYIENIEYGIYESLEDQPELKEILEANQENLVRRIPNGETIEKVYGLSSRNNIKLKSVGLGDDFVISVPAISDKKDNAFKVIKWLYE